MTAEFFKSDIQTLRKLLDTRQISAVELTQYFLKRIKDAQPKLNCMITVCEEEAILRARAAQDMIDQGNIRIWTGIPIVLSDHISTKGILTTCASGALQDYIPGFHATVYRKLKGYGAVILGKTNMGEFGVSDTSHFGDVFHPLTGQKVPGSAAGSAAAVAAGLCVAAVAADTVGSLRNSAAACGVTGIKPAYASVSRFGLIGCASGMDQIGVITRYAKDCGHMLDAITDYDPNDPTMLEPKCFDYAQQVGKSFKGKKIGLLSRLPCDASIAEAVKTLGCETVPVDLPSLEWATRAYYALSSAEMTSSFAFLGSVQNNSQTIGEDLQLRLMTGQYLLQEGKPLYEQAQKLRQQLQNELQQALTVCDALIVPTLYTPSDRGDTVTAAVNLSGLPAITVPVSQADEKPKGVTLIGRMFDEVTLIGMADGIEHALAEEGIK